MAQHKSDSVGLGFGRPRFKPPRCQGSLLGDLVPVTGLQLILHCRAVVVRLKRGWGWENQAPHPPFLPESGALAKTGEVNTRLPCCAALRRHSCPGCGLCCERRRPGSQDSPSWPRPPSPPRGFNRRGAGGEGIAAPRPPAAGWPREAARPGLPTPCQASRPPPLLTWRTRWSASAKPSALIPPTGAALGPCASSAMTRAAASAAASSRCRPPLCPSVLRPGAQALSLSLRLGTRTRKRKCLPRFRRKKEAEGKEGREGERPLRAEIEDFQSDVSAKPERGRGRVRPLPEDGRLARSRG